MDKTCAFYTLFSRSSPTKALVCQRCIKSCMNEKISSSRTLTATRVLLLSCFLKECLCKLVLSTVYRSSSHNHFFRNQASERVLNMLGCFCLSYMLNDNHFVHFGCCSFCVLDGFFYFASYYFHLFLFALSLF